MVAGDYVAASYDYLMAIISRRPMMIFECHSFLPDFAAVLTKNPDLTARIPRD
jgi:hypothetical protein